MKMKNKIGATGNQIMIFQYLFILVVISVAFFIGISIFFGQGYDFRQTQADILSYKINECLVKNPELNWGNFFSICGLNKDLMEKNKLYFKICDEMDFSACSSVINPKVSVGSNFQTCFFNDVSADSKYPRCSLRKMQNSSNINEKFVLIVSSDQKVREVNP